MIIIVQWLGGKYLGMRQWHPHHEIRHFACQFGHSLYWIKIITG